MGKELLDSFFLSLFKILTKLFIAELTFSEVLFPFKKMVFLGPSTAFGSLSLRIFFPLRVLAFLKSRSSIFWQKSAINFLGEFLLIENNTTWYVSESKFHIRNLLCILKRDSLSKNFNLYKLFFLHFSKLCFVIEGCWQNVIS